MRLDVAKALKSEGREVDFAYRLPLRDQDFMGEDIRFTSEADIKGVMLGQSNGVVLRGTLSVEYERPCASCLTPVKCAVDCEFEDLFTEEPDPEEPSDLFIIENNSIDLTGYAESLAFLNMPMVARCRPDCKGLCPVCGRNLNIDPCACGASVLHLVTDDEEAQEDNTQKPFAALQDLLSRNEEV